MNSVASEEVRGTVTHQPRLQNIPAWATTTPSLSESERKQARRRDGLRVPQKSGTQLIPTRASLHGVHRGEAGAGVQHLKEPQTRSHYYKDYGNAPFQKSKFLQKIHSEPNIPILNKDRISVTDFFLLLPGPRFTCVP